jgi:hypothetical protein
LNQTLVHYLQAIRRSEVSTTDKFVQHYTVGVKPTIWGANNRADGTISYNDFGAGIMFIPSGLAYYAAGVLVSVLFTFGL